MSGYPHFDHSAYEADPARKGELAKVLAVIPDPPRSISTESELFEFLGWLRRDDLEMVVRDVVCSAAELDAKLGEPEDERIAKLEARLDKAYADYDELETRYDYVVAEADQLRAQVADLRRLAAVYSDDPTVLGLVNKALSTDSDHEARACIERARERMNQR